MNVDYSKAITELDARSGRVQTLDDWRRVGEKSRYTPEELTEDDFTVIGFFAGDIVAQEARKRCGQARLAAAKLNANPDATEASAPAAAQRGDAEMKRRPERRRQMLPREGESWEAYVERCPSAPVPLVVFDRFGDDIIDHLNEMNTKNVSRNERLDAHEARLAALEARPELSYAGKWMADQPYSPGALVTRNGSLWLAKEATLTTPGTPDSGWQLIVKSGDAR